MERLIVHFSVIVLLLQSSSNAARIALSAEELSLNEIRLHFSNGSQLNRLWVGSSPCLDEWRGVICDNETASIVIGLHLSHMQLQGHIPKGFSQLRHLQELWLDHNQLRGTIPIDMGNLANLKSLRLHGNRLKGYLPENLRAIPDLSYDPKLICNAPDDSACGTLNPNSTSRKMSVFQNSLVNSSPVQIGSQSLQNLENDVQNSKVMEHTAVFSEVSKRILLLQLGAPSPLIALHKDEDKEIWTCLCDPGGILGKQNYSRISDSFTDCNCTSACPMCVTGQVLDPLVSDAGHCSCVTPLLVVVEIFNVQLSNYTLSMERSFTRNFARALQVSPSQVVPIARHGVNVILDIYILPFSGSTNYADMKATETILIQKNSSGEGILQDPILGPFSILRIENPLESSYSYASRFSGHGTMGKLFLSTIILCIILVAIALLVSVACFIHHKYRVRIQFSNVSFDKDNSTNSFTNLISQGSSFTEEFHAHDSSCLRSITGCMGRKSFKFNSKSEMVPGTIVQQFSYSQLAEATEQFSTFNLIGMGGSSSVYRGQLRNGRTVAVKKLVCRNGPDTDSEFLIEVELLSRLHHFHLVLLIGYCIEYNGREVQRLLVYEYMPNGNLRNHLDGTLGRESLHWITRVRIALGAARGLEYLHEAATPRVLHRDFKSSNILLDSKWRAKVADFGTAKTITSVDLNGQPSSPAKLLGTFGYFAPEYAMMGRASLKSDVFSFGVVLLELISGRRPIDMSLPQGQQSLVIWASPFLQDEKKVLNEIVDPVLKNGFPIEDMLKMAQLARACLQMDPESRPVMTAVVQVLAMLIPNNARKSASLPTYGVQIPFSMSWNPDFCNYNFSREEDLDLDESVMPSKQVHTGNVISGSTFEPEIQKMCCSQKWTGRHTILLGLEEILASQEEPKLDISNGTSLWSASDYLKSFSSSTTDNPARRSLEGESLDLTEPRMESFWHHNVF